MTPDAVLRTILRDPLDATLPLEDDLRRAIGFNADDGHQVIEPALREADLLGNLQWGDQERRRHNGIEGRSCLISVTTASERETYSLVVVTNGQWIAHIALNRLFPHLTRHQDPTVGGMARWNLIKSVKRKVLFYGFLPSVGFVPHRTSFNIARSQWDGFSDEDRNVAIERLRRLAGEYRAVSFDLPGQGGLEIFGHLRGDHDDYFNQGIDRDLGQLISDGYSRREILYEE